MRVHGLTYEDGEYERQWLAQENSELRSQLLAITQLWTAMKNDSLFAHDSWCKYYDKYVPQECTCSVQSYVLRLDAIIYGDV